MISDIEVLFDRIDKKKANDEVKRLKEEKN